MGAALAANPQMQGFQQRMALQQAVMDAKQQYPRLTKWPVVLDVGKGEGYSETYPPDEDANPHRPMWTVQLRHPSVVGDPSKWPDYLGLESLHWLQKEDPKYQQFTSQFINSMTDRQLGDAYQSYQREGDHRSFSEWLHTVQAQEYIRGGLFPRAIPNWLGPKGEGAYTPDQMRLLKQINQYLRSND